VIPDENAGLDEKSLRIGRKNIQILVDIDDLGDIQTLPIARILRDGLGNLIYDESFIPPCVQINANPTLMLLMRRSIEVVQEKSAMTSLDSQSPGKFQSGFSAQEIGQFWFLHAINSSLGPLRHLVFTKRGHPEELFLELLRLSAALCTFALDSSPRNLPPV
jgi:type VI secretion system protein ImpJ